MSRRPARTPEVSAKARLYRERRERNRKKRDVFGIVRFLLVLVLVGQGVRVAFTSPRMRLKEVRVEGTSRFTPAQIIQMGHVPVNQNIFRVNLVRVSEALKHAPVIKEAAVKRELPDTLRVEVQERHPAILVRSESGAYHADSDGVLFERAPDTPGKLPVLEMASARVPQLGGTLSAEWIHTVGLCTELAQKEHLSVEKLRVDEGGELWLNVGIKAAGQAISLPVRMGRAADLPEKFRDIRLSLLGFKDRMASAKYLNVMCAGQPALGLPDSDGKHSN